jgi:hypothetical protein
VSFLNDLVTLFEEDGVATLNVDLSTSSKATVRVLANGAATLQLIATGGAGPEWNQNNTTRPAFLKPGVQVNARADDPETAFAMAQAAFDSCAAVRNRFIASGWYRGIHMLQSEPFELVGPDDNAQARYTFNVVGDFNRRT